MKKSAIAKLSFSDVLELVRADARDVVETLKHSTGLGAPPAPGPTLGQILDARTESEHAEIRKVWSDIFEGVVK